MGLGLSGESERKGHGECARSWVTAGHRRSKICIFCGLPFPPVPCTTPAGTRVCTHTCGPKTFACSNPLGFVHQTRKGKAKEDFPFVALSLLMNPRACSHGRTNAASRAERVPPSLPSAPAPLPSSAQTLEREHSASPGTARARAGYANTDLVSALLSLSSTRVRARALSPSSPALRPLRSLLRAP